LENQSWVCRAERRSESVRRVIRGTIVRTSGGGWFIHDTGLRPVFLTHNEIDADPNVTITPENNGWRLADTKAERG